VLRHRKEIIKQRPIDENKSVLDAATGFDPAFANHLLLGVGGTETTYDTMIALMRWQIAGGPPGRDKGHGLRGQGESQAPGQVSALRSSRWTSYFESDRENPRASLGLVLRSPLADACQGDGGALAPKRVELASHCVSDFAGSRRSRCTTSNTAACRRVATTTRLSSLTSQNPLYALCSFCSGANKAGELGVPIRGWKHTALTDALKLMLREAEPSMQQIL